MKKGLRWRRIAGAAACLGVLLGPVLSWAGEALPSLTPEESSLYTRIADRVSLESFESLSPGMRRWLARLAEAPRPRGPSYAAPCFSGPMPDDVTAYLNETYYGGGRQKFEPAVERWRDTALGVSGTAQGDPVTLTYGFVPDGTIIPEEPFFGNTDQPSNLFAFLDGLYPSRAAWQDRFHQEFTRWGSITGVTYVFEPTDDGAAFPQSGVTGGAPGLAGVRGDIRIAGYFIDGEGGPNVFAFNFFPEVGDMVLDTGNPTFFGPDGGTDLGLRNVVAHEAGHGLGMPHTCPVDQTKLMEPAITSVFDGPQHDDMLGAQRLYGDFAEPNDAVFAATDFGFISETSAFTTNVSIDGRFDEDFIQFAIGANQEVSVVLVPQGSEYLSGPQTSGTCDPGVLIDTLAMSDLAFDLLDTDGATVLASADTGGAGVVEQISSLLVSGAGTYFVRVYPQAGAQDNIQLYALAVIVVAGPPLPPEARFDSATYSVGEGDGTRTVTVTLSEAPAALETVDYFTTDLTARAGADYVAASGTLSFGISETAKDFSITIWNDPIVENSEALLLTLSNPSAGLTLGSPSTAVLTIEDDDESLSPGGRRVPVSGLLGLGIATGAMAMGGVLRLRRSRR